MRFCQIGASKAKVMFSGEIGLTPESGISCVQSVLLSWGVWVCERVSGCVCVCVCFTDHITSLSACLTFFFFLLSPFSPALHQCYITWPFMNILILPHSLCVCLLILNDRHLLHSVICHHHAQHQPSQPLCEGQDPSGAFHLHEQGHQQWRGSPWRAALGENDRSQCPNLTAGSNGPKFKTAEKLTSLYFFYC